MLLKMIVLALPLVGLGGCAVTPPAGPETPPVPENECDASGLQRFIGQTASAPLGTEMLAASGARSLRWVAPGMAVTMDFRPDRLTVKYDAAMKIESAQCG